MEKCFIKKIDGAIVNNTKELWTPQIIKTTITLDSGDGTSFRSYIIGYLPAGDYIILLSGNTSFNATLRAGVNNLIDIGDAFNKREKFVLPSSYEKDALNIVAPNIGGTYTVYIFDANNYNYELVSQVKLLSEYYNGTCVWYNPFDVPNEIRNNGEIFVKWHDTKGLLKDYILGFMNNISGNPSLGQTEFNIYCSLGVIDATQFIIQGSNSTGTDGDTEIIFEFYHRIE